MNCRDFDRSWNELLDAEAGPRLAATAGGARLGLERELREHAHACPSCGPVHGRFEALRAAMRAWSARPRPEPEAADRILRAVAGPTSLAMPSPSRPARGALAAGILALVAGAAAAAFLVIRGGAPGAGGTGPHGGPVPDSLSVALADARDASWRLALSASEPAARLGLAMIDASLDGDESTASAFDPDGAEPLDPAALLDRFGDYAAAGARPLSDAARQALGFLRSPTLDAPDRPAPPPADPNGA